MHTKVVFFFKSPESELIEENITEHFLSELFIFACI